MELPLRMSLKLSETEMADLVSLVPGVDRISADEVTYQAEDVIAMLRMFRVMLGLAWSKK